MLAELRAEIGNLPHAAAHLARLARHYRPGRGLGRGVRRHARRALRGGGAGALRCARSGDRAPRRRRCTAARSATPPRSPTRCSRAARALAAAGYEPTVHVRAGAPLSFFHPDGRGGTALSPAAGGRRVRRGRRRAHATRRDALLAALDADPLRFSTSALLRPIVQDALLPTAAYVGGPAEVAYFAQLAPLYAAYDLAMPLVVPRARLRVRGGADASRSARGSGSRPTTPTARPPSCSRRGRRARRRSTTRRWRRRSSRRSTPRWRRCATHVERVGPGLDARRRQDPRHGRRRPSRSSRARSSNARTASRPTTQVDGAGARAAGRWCRTACRRSASTALAYFAARYGERAFVDARARDRAVRSDARCRSRDAPRRARARVSDAAVDRRRLLREPRRQRRRRGRARRGPRRARPSRARDRERAAEPARCRGERLTFHEVAGAELSGASSSRSYGLALAETIVEVGRRARARSAARPLRRAARRERLSRVPDARRARRRAW